MRPAFSGAPLLGGMPPRGMPGVPPFFPGGVPGGMPAFGARPPFRGTSPGGRPTGGAPMSGGPPPSGAPSIGAPGAPAAGAPRPGEPQRIGLSGPKPNGTDNKPPAQQQQNKGPSINPDRMAMINKDQHKPGLPGGFVPKPHDQHAQQNNQSLKRTGADAVSPSDPKKFRPNVPPQGPPAPHLNPLRTELQQLIVQTPPTEMAALACSAVTGSAQNLKDDFANQFVEATYEFITRYLGLQQNQLSMFRDRVGSNLKTEISSFLDKTFQTELVQLLIATTHADPRQNLFLRNKVLQIIQQGDQHALNGVRDQINKLKELRNKPPQATPQAPPQQFTPQPQFNPQFPQQQFNPHQVPAKQSNPEIEKGLCNAALSGDLASVQNFLNQGADVNASHDGGWTALMNATLQGHLPIVKHLLTCKAKLDLKDNGGFTALMYAASYNRVQIAEELVAAGASLDVVDNSGRNISHYTQDAQVKAAVERGTAAYKAAQAAAAAAPAHHVPTQNMPGTMPGLAAFAQMAQMSQQQPQMPPQFNPTMMGGPMGHMGMGGLPPFVPHQNFGR